MAQTTPNAMPGTAMPGAKLAMTLAQPRSDRADATQPVRGPRRRRWAWPIWLATALSLAWLAVCIQYVSNDLNWSTLSSLLPHELGGLLTGLVGPMALAWMAAAYVQRGRDVQAALAPISFRLQELIEPRNPVERRFGHLVDSLKGAQAAIDKVAGDAVARTEAVRRALDDQSNAAETGNRAARAELEQLTGSLRDYTETLSGLVEKIGGNINSFSNFQRVSEQQLDRISLRVAERLAAAGERLAADTATFETRVAKVFDRLDTSIADMDERGRDLTGNAEEVARRLDASAATYGGQLARMADLTGPMEQETVRLGGMLDNHAAGVSQSVREAGALLAAARGPLDAGLASLDGSIAALGEREAALTATTTLLGQLEARIREHDGSLGATAESWTVRAETLRAAATHIVTALDAATERAVDGSDRILGSLTTNNDALIATIERGEAIGGRLGEQLRARVEDIDAASETAEQRLADLAARLSAAREGLVEAAEVASRESARLGETLGRQGGDLSAATGGLSSTIAEIVAKIDQRIEMLRAASAAADTRARELTDGLDRRIAGLQTASERTETQLEAMRNSLSSQAQTVATVSGQIAQHARGLNDELEARAGRSRPPPAPP
ncbi:MAG: hypothetical protein EXQ87_13770 [Alphaproteobacteria bacterium]|nr:hypothetical protein [Alphaproteobacteria bacterium]